MMSLDWFIVMRHTLKSPYTVTKVCGKRIYALRLAREKIVVRIIAAMLQCHHTE